MDFRDDEPAPGDDAPEAHPGSAQQDGGPRADEEPLSVIRQRYQRARRRRALAISGALVVVLVIGVLVYPRLSAKPPTGAQESGYENTRTVPGAPALGPDMDVLWRVPAPPSGDGAVNARVLSMDGAFAFVAKETAQGDIWVAALSTIPDTDPSSARRTPALLWASTIKDPGGLGDAPMTGYASHSWRDVWNRPEDSRGSDVFIKDWAVDARTGAVRRAPWADSDAAPPSHAVGTFNETVVACGTGCSGWTYSRDSGWSAAWTRDAVRIPRTYQQSKEKPVHNEGSPPIWVLLDPDEDGALPILNTKTGEVRTPFPIGTSSSDVYAAHQGWVVADDASATVTSYTSDGTPDEQGALAAGARSTVPLKGGAYSHLTGGSGADDTVAQVTGEECDSLIIGRPFDDPPAVRVPASAPFGTRIGDSCVPTFTFLSPLASEEYEPIVALTENGGTNPPIMVLIIKRTDEKPDGPRVLLPQEGSPPMVLTTGPAALVGVDENGIIGFVPKVEKQ